MLLNTSQENSKSSPIAICPVCQRKSKSSLPLIHRQLDLTTYCYTSHLPFSSSYCALFNFCPVTEVFISFTSSCNSLFTSQPQESPGNIFLNSKAQLMTKTNSTTISSIFEIPRSFQCAILRTGDLLVHYQLFPNTFKNAFLFLRDF